MTEIVPFIDLVFGLLEGWWFYDDGRTHAVIPAEHWEKDLHTAGFDHVDWTDGSLPENNFQRVMMATASGPQQKRLPKPIPAAKDTNKPDQGDLAKREAEAERFVAKYTQGWTTPQLDAVRAPSGKANSAPEAAVIAVVGATGSLGSHLVQALSENPAVATVVCINRRTSTPAAKRQNEGLSSHGITLSAAAATKLRGLDADTSKPLLGLDHTDYTYLTQNVTHIILNAWPMSGTRPIAAFEPQFQTLRNLLDLARDAALLRPDAPTPIGFQFISSIGVVGNIGTPTAPETRVPLAAALPGGYTDAKWACERMLDATLHAHNEAAWFRPMVVRPGQIAGPSTSGFWNPAEHFAFIVKSAQALRAWPDLRGRMQWVPADHVAAACAELLGIGEARPAAAHPVYHVDNPVGQPWEDMSPVLAATLDIPADKMVPFHSWCKLVRRAPLHPEVENPAVRLIDWLEENFEKMSCGGMVLDTARAREHSRTMAMEGPVTADVARGYVGAWKEMGVLNK